ncbi:acid protease [Thozetella sp. PMI_491]|nr:acid protease [Thozetella sp. PMI_491]
MAVASVALLSLLSAANAINVARDFPGATVGAGYVHVPVSRQNIEPGQGQLRRRAGAAAADLANAQNSGYFINVTLGTPGQVTTVVVDSGSIELWVDPDCSTGRKPDPKDTSSGSTNGVDNPDEDPDFCDKVGRYDHSKSSTAKTTDVKDKTIKYADFTTVDVTYYQDTLSIGGVSVTNQIFGVATKSNQTQIGILGIGPNPLGFNYTPEYPYALMLSNMQKQGLIQSRAFSLDLREFDNTTGALIFGGVDKSKFQGSLSAIPIVPFPVKNDDGTTWNQTSYNVNVKSMSFTPAGGKSSTKNYDLPGGTFIADLDSGTGAILTPPGFTKQICADVNGNMTGTNCLVDCSYRQQSGGLTFGFEGGKTILVPYDNLFWPITDRGTTYCWLQVGDSTIVSDPPTYILGAPFLRSAYAVFDWDNQNVHLAQNANCGNSDIVAIGTGANAVPTGGNCSPAPRSAVLNMGLVLAAAILGSFMIL